MRMFSQIFPLSEICKDEEGYKELKKALSLAFLNGGLPQGTCASPFIVNAMCIPMDFKLFNELAARKIVYTRYADDIHISAQEMFNWREVVKFIQDTLKEFDAPFELNPEKTHFGKKAGRSANWMLGLLLNKDNNITISAKKKGYFRAALCSFVLDTKNKKYWDVGDVLHLNGQISYYSMIEPEYVNEIIDRYNRKWNVNIRKMMAQYLNVA